MAVVTGKVKGLHSALRMAPIRGSKRTSRQSLPHLRIALACRQTMGIHTECLRGRPNAWVQAKRMGAGPQHNWVKGSRVPPQYRSSHYVVNDWRGHGLKRPARGQQWVQYGGDYLLVAVATGVIAQLVLGY